MSRSFPTHHLPRPVCEWLLDHGSLISAGVALLTIGFAYLAISTPMSGDPLHAFLDDKAALDQHVKRSAQFGSDTGKLLIAVTDEGNSLFSASVLNNIRGAASELRALPMVWRVDCLPDAYPSPDPNRRLSLREVARRTLARQRLAAGKLPDTARRLRRLWPFAETRQRRVELDRLRESTLQDDSLVGKFVTLDGRYQAMIITLDPEREYSTAAQLKLRNQIAATLRRHSLGQAGQHLIGLPVMNLAIVAEMDNALKIMLPVCVLLLGLAIYGVFGQVKVVLISIGLGLIAVAWGIGATALVFGELTILVAAAPVVILAVSTADFIHLTSAYQQKLGAGRPQRAAIVDVFSEVGGACILTSLTTLIGFGALMLVDSPTVRHFGFAIALGSAIALLLVIGMLPYVFANVRPIQPVTSSVVGQWCNRSIGTFANTCNRISARYPMVVFLLCVLPCVPSVLAIASRPIEADVPGRFPADHEWNQSLALADNLLSGSHFLEFFITAPAERLADPQVIAGLQTAHTQVLEAAAVKANTSIITLYRAIDGAIGYETPDRLPPSSISAAASVAWMRAVLPDFTRSVINESGDELRMCVMVGAMGFRALHRLAVELEGVIAEQLPEDLRVEWGGTYPLVGSVVSDIVFSQIRGFGFCVASLTVIMVLGLRSLRMGVVAQIPNLIPVILMLGLIAATRSQIDSDMLGLPMIALGLAVDDTIHFLHRFRHAETVTSKRRRAVDQVFESAGRSIVISTVALCIGLLPLAFSSFLSLWMLGTYLAAGLACAVIADLLCLPAMIHMGWLSSDRTAPRSRVDEGVV